MECKQITIVLAILSAPLPCWPLYFPPFQHLEDFPYESFSLKYQARMKYQAIINKKIVKGITECQQVLKRQFKTDMVMDKQRATTYQAI